MDVIVLRPLCERLREYRPGDTLPVAPERAARLEELGLVSAQRAERPAQVTAPAEKEYAEGWRKLRALIGAKRVPIPTFATRRSRLDELRPGEKFLILLRYAGIGDHINASMMFPALWDQYPEIRVTYAIPIRFHCVFDGTGVQCISHDGPVQPAWFQEYDLIEDINTPCHLWENFFVARGGTTGDGHGLRWRNRLDVMSQWFGLRVTHPRSPIVIREEEKVEARELIAQTGRTGKPLCLLAPISFAQARSYPWFAELAERLTTHGWDLRLLYPSPLPGPVPTLAGLSLRMMGAVCAVADLIVSTDTAAYHWGGILGRPTVAFFNSQLGTNHCRDYPTVHPVQTCATPCIHNVRWHGDHESCPHLSRDVPPNIPGLPLSRCFGRETVDQIMTTVRTVSGHPQIPGKESARR